MPVRRRTAPVLLSLLLAFAARAGASPEDEARADGTRRSVARLAWLEGDVSIARGSGPDDRQPGAVNFPMTTGDRLRAGNAGRAELQLRGAFLFVAPGTELAFEDLSRDRRSFALPSGTATVQVFDLPGANDLEITTPNASVALELPGAYRIDVSTTGGTEIGVSRGRARVATAEGGLRLGWGERMRVVGLGRPEYDVVDLRPVDEWDRWVERRSRRLRDVRSAARVHAGVCGVDDLDEWGGWENTSDWGWAWFPRVSLAGWMPYRSGRWVWRDPWGWTWLSAEPWGWAPYHYGRWVLVRNRWAWLPVGPKESRPAWCPAVVAFVEAEPGGDGSPGPDGYIGWFPLGPREALAPWWIESTAPTSDPPQRFLHRERALYLPRAVFVRGHAGERDLLRDPDLLRGLRNAPLLRGPLPALPGREGIGATRGLSRADAAAFPTRPKPVRRVAPAPAPTSAGASSSAPARPTASAPPTPNGPPAPAPPWPDEGRRPEPRPPVAGESAAEPRGTTSGAPPWGVSSTPAPVPRDQIPASKRRR